MTLEELGAALRAEREKRGLSVDDVAAHLKIGARQLRALEEGDTASLPHPAYTKGFIRSYAAYVGLAVEEVNGALAELHSDAEAVPQSVYEPEHLLGPQRNLKPVLALAAVLLLVGLGWLAWRQGALDFVTSQTRRLAQPAPEAEVVPSQERAVPLSSAQSPQVAEAPLAPPKTAPQSAASAQPSVTAGRGASGTPAGVSAGEAAPSVSDEVAPAPVGTPGWGGQPAAPAAQTGPGQAGAGQAGQGPAAEEQGGQHKVILTALEECWVHSNADNTDTRQFSLRKGDTFALTFSKSLELKLGNAGGVRLRYDGQDLPPAGQSGQVRTLKFPPAQP